MHSHRSIYLWLISENIIIFISRQAKNRPLESIRTLSAGYSYPEFFAAILFSRTDLSIHKRTASVLCWDTYCVVQQKGCQIEVECGSGNVLSLYMLGKAMARLCGNSRTAQVAIVDNVAAVLPGWWRETPIRPCQKYAGKSIYWQIT